MAHLSPGESVGTCSVCVVTDEVRADRIFVEHAWQPVRQAHKTSENPPADPRPTPPPPVDVKSERWIIVILIDGDWRGGGGLQRRNIDWRDEIKMDRWQWLSGRRERRQDGCERWRDGEISTIISDYQRESWCVFVLRWQTVVSFPVQEIMKLADLSDTHTQSTNTKY